MRLVNSTYDIRFDLVENSVQVICIESQMAFRAMTESMWKQAEGGDGDWILSDGEKTLSISKKTSCIMNPFALDCNEKKILTKIYSQISELASEEYLTETAELNGQILCYIDTIIGKVPYELDEKVELDISGLLKLYDVKLNVEFEGLLEKIISYIRTVHLVCGIDVVVFVGIKQFLSEMEILELYEFSFYNKVHLVLMESVYINQIDHENVFILDKDLCIIMP